MLCSCFVRPNELLQTGALTMCSSSHHPNCLCLPGACVQFATKIHCCKRQPCSCSHVMKTGLLPRLAPLSQGRIEPAGSTLMCSYHGWSFNGQGRAVSIPQAHFQNPAAEEAACNSNRSCVKAFPTAVCLCCTAQSQLKTSLIYVASMSFAMQSEAN